MMKGKTRGKKEAVVHTRCGMSIIFPIVGEVKHGSIWCSETWTADGHCFEDGHDYVGDLIEIDGKPL